MKILHVIAGLAPRNGGPHKAAPELCRALARLGHDTAIFTTNLDGDGVLDVPTDRPVREDGITIRYFQVGAPRFWKLSLPLGRALRDHVPHYDIVHVHSLYLFHTLAAGHYCRHYGVPYIVRPHGTLDPYIRRKSRLKKAIYNFLIEKRHLDRAAAIHYTAEDEMKVSHEPCAIRSPGVVVPLGIEPGDYEKLPAFGIFRSRYPETLGKVLILFLGRITPKKGFDLLARSYGSLARNRTDIHLAIVGPDDEGYGNEVRRMLAGEGVLDRVTFTGMLLGQEKLSALRDADLFILPSYAENFGVAVVEAMACGLPVLISNKVNIRCEIDGARAGVIVNCEHQELTHALTRLIQDSSMRSELGSNGRALVRDKFTWDRVASEMESVYQRILDRTPARKRQGKQP